MKGMTGIVISLALAGVAAFCNWFYVYKQASGYHTVPFVIIAPTVQLNAGDTIRNEHLAPVNIPEANVIDLKATAVLWGDRETIIGIPAVKSYRGGELFLQQDRVTTARKDISEMLAVNEVAFPVPVDPRTFMSDNFNPGDNVSFFVPEFMSIAEPTPVTAGNAATNPSQLIGPFRILALGARRGAVDIAEAANRRNTREDIVTISLDRKDGEFNDKAKQLLTALRVTSGKGVQVVKHSSAKK